MKKYLESITFRTLIPFFIFIVGLLVVEKALTNIQFLGHGIANFLAVMTPFINGFAIAYLVHLLCLALQKGLLLLPLRWVQNHYRGLSIFLSYFVLLLFFYLSLRWLIPYLIHAINNFSQNLDLYAQNAQKFVDDINTSGFLPVSIDIKKMVNIDKVFEWLKKIQYDDFSEYLKKILQVSSFFLNTFLSFVLSIYYLIEADAIRDFLYHTCKKLFPPSFVNVLFKYTYALNFYMKTYIGCLLIDSAVLIVLISVAMMLIGIDYWLILGIFVGLFNVIPYFGAIIAVCISCLFVLFTIGVKKALLVLVVLLLIQQFDGNIIQPKIMGDSLKLSPILIIFAITVGAAYFGIPGMILSIPIITVVKNIVLDLLNAVQSSDTSASDQ